MKEYNECCNFCKSNDWQQTENWDCCDPSKLCSCLSITDNANWPTLDKLKDLKRRQRAIGLTEQTYITTFDLNRWEKLLIVICFMIHRTTQMFLAVNIMCTYDYSQLFLTVFGLAMGNFFFNGLCQDQVIISGIKKQLRQQRIINQRIKSHNIAIENKLLRGKMTLVRDHEDQVQMSLTKIQNEISII